MPSIFSHAVAGLALANAGTARDRWKLLLAAALSAMVPDLDAVGHMLGVPYDSFWGHRGFTHSAAFACLWGALLAFAFFRQRFVLAWVVLALATISHPLLDMCTNGGLGCALWAPFNNERLFFPWRPIRVAPIGVGAFFTERGLGVFASEVEYVWSPSLFLLIASAVVRRVIRSGGDK
ncbi:MAG: metal-dependent hydrolase [Flavobacteriales bacterium]|nr:metal-dependent hydrolase [Flavobacteriales bacterium]